MMCVCGRARMAHNLDTDMMDELRDELKGEMVWMGGESALIEQVGGMSYDYHEDELTHDDSLGYGNATDYGLKLGDEWVDLETVQENLQSGAWEM